MRYFITGGTSSIGRVLVREIALAGNQVTVLVRPTSDLTGLRLPGVRFVRGDVISLEDVRRGMVGCSRVCHLAAIVGHQVPEAVWWQVNRDGSENVLKAAAIQGVESFVQVSTLSVLGPTAPGEIGDETRLPDPEHYFNLYQRTKRAADDIAREYYGCGLNVKIVYPAFGYGCSWAGSHPTLTDQTLLRMAHGKPIAIMGSGKNRFCVAYYKDTARGIILAHEVGKAGEDYILGGENLSFREIWSEIAKILGRKPPNLRIPIGLLRLISNVSMLISGKSLFPPEFFELISLNWAFSSEKAERELGWQPTNFADGIRETWQEYKAGYWRMGSVSRQGASNEVRS